MDRLFEDLDYQVMHRARGLWQGYGITVFTVWDLRVDVFASLCQTIDRLTGDADG